MTSTTNIKPQNGIVQWQSPSNIALVKYWGKYGQQMPQNSSISFTLDAAHTQTSIEFDIKPTNNFQLDFYFENKSNDLFKNKIEKYLLSIQKELLFLQHAHLVIRSENTFPHSSGIASSASAMSAIALAVCDIDRKTGHIQNANNFLKKASNLARIGSGSACRSIYPGIASWGKNPKISKSSNLYATPFLEADPIFHTFHDDICIVSKKEKSVSSRAGHGLMEGNIYAKNRYAQANQRILQLITAMKEGDLNTFGQIVEDEALTLHALMMASTPSFTLLEPNTIEMIKRIRAFRMDTKLPLFFTLDAGPNIHLLYPDHIANQVVPFIETHIKPICESGLIIKDKVGTGPIKLK